MRTKLSLFIFLILGFIYSDINAQSPYVTIPDENFRSFLEATYPSCMSSGQLDTTCTTIVNLTVLNVNDKNISDLTGVQYFDKLGMLYCSNNLLTSLPNLPSTLFQLSCSKNQIVSLPELPSSLKFLFCENNKLTTLPELPLLLEEIDCANNEITELPSLPSSLIYLDCKNNNLDCLPTLNNNLEYIRAAGNNVVCLPNKPAGISTDISTICNDGTGCGILSAIEEKSFEEDHLSIYPNPSNCIFNIIFNSDLQVPEKIEIIDQFGRMVFSSGHEKILNKLVINLSSEQSGVYLLKATYGNYVVSKKIYLN